MRVLHWYPNFLAGGGVANAVQALALAQGRLGADVWIAGLECDAPIYGPAIPDRGVEITAWTARRSLGRGAMKVHLMDRLVRQRLEAVRPDVVHAHAEFNPDNWWTPHLWRCPLVLTPHGAYHPAVLERGPRRKRIYLAVAHRLLYQHVDAFHALNPAEQRDISAALPRVRTFYVPHGPSPSVEIAMRHHAAKPRRGGPIRFMFVGRLDVRTKGLDVLVKAFAHAVAGTSRKATLTLVGPTWRNGDGQLRALVGRLGVAHLVDMRGCVPATDVPAVLEECDVYVHLSRNEGSPLSVNDALALGKPIIVSNRVGTVSCPEIARMRHVKIVPPEVPAAADAIAAALADFTGFQRLAGLATRETRELLSWSRAARAHLVHYRSLVAGQPARSIHHGRRRGGQSRGTLVQTGSAGTGLGGGRPRE